MTTSSGRYEKLLAKGESGSTVIQSSTDAEYSKYQVNAVLDILRGRGRGEKAGPAQVVQEGTRITIPSGRIKGSKVALSFHRQTKTRLSRSNAANVLVVCFASITGRLHDCHDRVCGHDAELQSEGLSLRSICELRWLLADFGFGLPQAAT